MRQTVILAAGNGQRINSAQNGHPKPMVRVAGRSLMEHALIQATSAGCEEAVVVVGCGAEVMEAHLHQLDIPIAIKVVYNRQADRPNGVSLLAAEEYADERFFLQMADHVFTRPVLGYLEAAEGPPGTCARLLVDSASAHLDEVDATKVQIEHDRIVRIGKKVNPWDAIDAGYFLLDRCVFTALRDVERSEEEPSVSAGMRRLAAENALAPVALPNVAWVDVDTPQDRDTAEQLLVSQAPLTPV
jgi:choline kinase